MIGSLCQKCGEDDPYWDGVKKYCDSCSLELAQEKLFQEFLRCGDALSLLNRHCPGCRCPMQTHLSTDRTSLCQDCGKLEPLLDGTNQCEECFESQYKFREIPQHVQDEVDRILEEKPETD